MAMLVCPANFIPRNGMTRRSVCASAVPGANSRKRIAKILANKQAEEGPGEERRVDVAVLQRERRAQTVAVGEKDQRETLRRYLEDERRVGARRVAELPIDRLSVVVLDEPAKPGLARRVGPHRRHRVLVEKAPVE